MWLLIDDQRRQAIVKALTPMWRVLETGVVRATDGLGVLTGAVAPVDPGEQAECLIAEVLVHRPNDDVPTAPEIQQELILRAPQPDLVPSIRELRSALATHPCFVEGPRYRYRLGVRYPLFWHNDDPLRQMRALSRTSTQQSTGLGFYDLRS